MKINFKLDENLPKSLKIFLLEKGFTISSVTQHYYETCVKILYII